MKSIIPKWRAIYFVIDNEFNDKIHCCNITKCCILQDDNIRKQKSQILRELILNIKYGVAHYLKIFTGTLIIRA